MTTHFYVWFEDFEMGMYTINQIYLVGVFTFRIVLTFPVSLKSMLLGFVLFVESLLTYSFLRANTLASYAGFLGQLVRYKEVYIEVIMLVLWTILTRDFIGLLLPVQIGKAKVSKVFRTIRETTIILK